MAAVLLEVKFQAKTNPGGFFELVAFERVIQERQQPPESSSGAAMK